ncbi:MAG: hypothetical protein ACR2IF_11695 [Terriglobales bacterium]
MPAEMAIIAALRREIWPLVKTWKQRAGPGHIEIFEKDRSVAICGGVGAAAARAAAELAFGMARPCVVISAGFAGALEPGLAAGDVFTPAVVIDARSGRKYPAGNGRGTLVSASAVSNTAAKRELATKFGAQAVDMEAAAVAEVAEAHGVAFAAVKGISDAAGFVLPPVARFVDESGRFHTGRFVVRHLMRPWTWPNLARLAVNSGRASRELCRTLLHLIEKQAREVPDAVSRT